MRFDLNRRTFLKVVGGTGMATLSGCAREPTKRIVSYLTPPEKVIPGVATWYASLCRECPAGCGVLVGTREGLPIKIEGNPLHPINEGALCARGQAALQGLYNLDRIREPARRVGEGSFERIPWEGALDTLAGVLRRLRSSDALDRVAIVTPHLAGSLSILLNEWLEEFQGVALYEYEPISYESVEKANEICFGVRTYPIYKLGEADLVISFGADFMETYLSPIEYSAGFARMRSYQEGKTGYLINFGPRHTLTAANADESVLARAGTYGALALGIVYLFIHENLAPIRGQIDLSALARLTERYNPQEVYEITGVPEGTLRHIARLLATARRSSVLPGGVELDSRNATQNIIAVNVLNYILGNFGKTVILPAKNDFPRKTTAREFSALVEKMRRGGVDLLIFYDVNPMHTMPPSSGFSNALKRVDNVVCCSDVESETASASDFVLPVHSPLESWGDYFVRDGVYGLMQPAIRPLGNSMHFGEVMIELSRIASGGSSDLSRWVGYYDYLLESWKNLARTLAPGEDFETFWEDALGRGGVFRETRSVPVVLSEKALSFGFVSPTIQRAVEAGPRGSQEAAPDIEEPYLLVYPSILRYDGRGSNKPWLQEVPDPMLQNVWGSCVEVSAEIASRMKLKVGDIVRVTSDFGSIEGPVYVSKHMHPACISVALGQGHRGYGRVATKVGANPIELLPTAFDELSGGRSYLSVKVRLQKTDTKEAIPTPQGSSYDEERGIVQDVSLAYLRQLAGERGLRPEKKHEFKDLLKPHDHPEHRWGMVIDLNACIGCSACVVACYAENNIAVVGKEQYLKGREMNWIRIERYFKQGLSGGTRFIPILCQQCDNAPCEPVCPVYATYHTKAGLNAQVYNRCVGTRYCANNCPYSVRRFNWFEFDFPEPLNLQLNPDVTVRSKGVMEKCSFCIQRIVLAKDRAKDENRTVRDGEIIPACAQTCPTSAITFGDLNDPDSEVSRRAKDARAYRVLEYLNTKPAITYLKKITVGQENV